jgi:glycosyltransferase involved in cell wall biosynthesis
MKQTYSICMLCYNNKQRLRESLDSVVHLKDYLSVEVIIADNFSTDGSNEILHEYAAQGQVRLLEVAASRGIARQEMLKQARGTYILSHMDCDDIFSTKALAGFIESYRKNYDGLMIMTKRPTEEASNITVAPKELLQSIGGWRDIQWGEDWDLWERAYEVGKYRFVPYPSVPLHDFILVRRERQSGARRKLSHRYLKYRDMLRVGRRPFQKGEHRSVLQRMAVALAITSVTLNRSRLKPIKYQDFDDMKLDSIGTLF